MAEEDDRFEQHEQLIQALARLWERQGEINDELRAMNKRLDTRLEGVATRVDRLEGSAERQDMILERVTRTLERVETLLERLPRGGDNGRREA